MKMPKSAEQETLEAEIVLAALNLLHKERERLAVDRMTKALLGPGSDNMTERHEAYMRGKQSEFYFAEAEFELVRLTDRLDRLLTKQNGTIGKAAKEE
jgi:hypothetical protein